MTFCGSPEYLSPEMLLCQGRSHMIDFYSLGTVLYEFVMGVPPFYSENQEEMFDQILNGDVDVKGDPRIPDMSELSHECRDIILRLLDKNPQTRLGVRGFDEFKNHPYFHVEGLTVDEYWQAVELKYVPPPPTLIPSPNENY